MAGGHQQLWVTWHHLQLLIAPPAGQLQGRQATSTGNKHWIIPNLLLSL
jgi:hypothetical protein